RLQLRAELSRQLVDIHTRQKLFNGFSAHHGNELSGVLLLQLPEFFFRQKLTFFQRSLAGIDRHIRLEIKNPRQFTQGHIEQVTDTAWQSLEEPDVRTRTRQLDVT